MAAAGPSQVAAVVDDVGGTEGADQVGLRAGSCGGDAASPDGGRDNARAYTGHTDALGPAGTTCIKADLQAVAIVLAAMTGHPYPLAT